MKHRILLIDDHPIMRHGLAQLIGMESTLVVCGEAGSAAAGLAAIEKLKPDLAIVDLTLPDKHGLELIKDIQVLRQVCAALCSPCMMNRFMPSELCVLVRVAT